MSRDSSLMTSGFLMKAAAPISSASFSVSVPPEARKTTLALVWC